MKTIARLGLLLFSLLLFSQLALSRDWQRSPAIVTLQGIRRLVATGDVHGALPQLLATLQRASLISPDEKFLGHYRWTGGKTVWISLGDYIDRGDHSLEVLQFIKELEPQAEVAGGKVITLMGNHEAMLLNGEVWRRGRLEKKLCKKWQPYSKTIDSFKKLEKPFDYVVSNKHEIGRFLRRMPIMAIINGRIGFVHGGFGQVTTLSEIRRSFQKCVDKEDWSAPYLSPRSEAEAQRSPLWARNWWENDKYVGHLLHNLGLQELVFAHTPGGLVSPATVERRNRIRHYIKSRKSKMNKRRLLLYERRLAVLEKEIDTLSSSIQTDGRLFNLDIGMCPWYKMSNGGCLEIIITEGSAVFRAVYPDKPAVLLKSDPLESSVIEGVEETL